jgi:hypothetical protein
LEPAVNDVSTVVLEGVVVRTEGVDGAKKRSHSSNWNMSGLEGLEEG